MGFLKNSHFIFWSLPTLTPLKHKDFQFFSLQHSYTKNTVRMTRYGATPVNPAKSASARGSYLRVSYKNTHETAQAINGWQLTKALKYLEDVSEHKRAIPFRKHAG